MGDFSVSKWCRVANLVPMQTHEAVKIHKLSPRGKASTSYISKFFFQISHFCTSLQVTDRIRQGKKVRRGAHLYNCCLGFFYSFGVPFSMLSSNKASKMLCLLAMLETLRILHVYGARLLESVPFQKLFILISVKVLKCSLVALKISSNAVRKSEDQRPNSHSRQKCLHTGT